METSQENWSRLLRGATPSNPPESGKAMVTALELASELGARIDPESVGCSITMVDGDGFVTPAASSPQALGLDQAQYAHNEGPCVAAAQTGAWHEIQSIQAETRWPFFIETAIAHGVMCSLSIPLTVPDRPAALNLYSASERAFADERRRAVAGFLARCLTAVLASSSTAEPPLDPPGLRESVAKGQVIIHALDAMSARRGISQAAAFRVLADASRAQSRPLVLLAQDVLQTDGR